MIYPRHGVSTAKTTKHVLALPVYTSSRPGAYKELLLVLAGL